MFLNIIKTHIKAVTCVFLIFCLSLFTLSGCSSKNDPVVQVEDYKVSSGMYAFILTQHILAAQQISSQTMSPSSDPEKIISEGKIEDKPAVDWIKEQSVDAAKQIASINVEFDKLGLTLSEEENNQINDSVEKIYEQAEKQGYSKLGITKEDWQQIAEINPKVQKVNKEYFEEGKSRAISNEKVDEYTKNHGLKYKVITIDKPLSEKDESSSKLLKNEGVANLKALVDKYMSQIANKKSIDDINAAYNKASEQPEAALEYVFQYDDLEFAEKEFVTDIKPNTPATLKEDDAAYYIIQRFDIDQESVEKQREVSKKLLLEAAQKDLIDELVNKYDIKVNQGAVDSHDPIEQTKILAEIQKNNTQSQQEQDQNQEQNEDKDENEDQNAKPAE